ncbi:MAG: tyrosine-type recombinase/integrase, partial [Candidatus Lindowbacteria bacterium]|nr:tyrosine-type recombinase/integrase [Candidatus Lindowbacteria bacterium]
MLELIYGCGLRWQELIELRCDDFDRNIETITIRNGDTIAWKREEWIERTLPRTIPLPSEAKKWLEMYLADVRPRIIEEKGCKSDDFFLGFMNGKPLQRAAVYARLEKTRNKTELKKRA